VSLLMIHSSHAPALSTSLLCKGSDFSAAC
jgi:hypothetical protein